MPDLVHQSPDNPEFARVLDMARLRGASEFVFDIAPEPAEATALARLMGVLSLRKMRFKGRLAPLGKGAWDLRAHLGATVVQTCVVSLEPVTTRLDTDVHRLYAPDLEAEPVDLVIADPDADEEAEPLPDRLDLGLVAIEALALAVPAYPRHPDADLGRIAAEVAPLPEDDGPKAFAALAALRARMDEGS